MRKVIANAQAGLEGLRWLRDEAELNGDAVEFVKRGHFSEAALLAIRGVARAVPRIDVRSFAPVLIDNKHEFMGMGAEAIVVKDGANVHKYLTGKTQKPEVLAQKLQGLHTKVEQSLGEYLVPTSIDAVRTKLFKGLPSDYYVRLTQPLLNIEHIDPHLDPDLLADRPEIAQSLCDLSSRLVDLFSETGLLMDVVNQGNIAWASCDDQPSQLYLLDTLPVDFAANDFMGIKIPFWSPNMHLEYLADFVNANNPGLLAE